MRSTTSTFALLALLYTAPALAAEPQGKIDFAAQVQPLLSKSCYACHGPAQQKSGLRLDQRDAALAPAESEDRAIVPGDAKKSRLLAVIDGSDKELSMPPKGTKLTPDQVALVRKWIEQGAEYNTHWAFVAPKRPELPLIKNEKLRDWPRNPIDRFILARLEAEGLAPSPEADAYTLIRRVHLDLIGIPPTPEEADAFASACEKERQHDAESAKQGIVGRIDIPHAAPRAYERLVDRLLASPAYGERWARRWLDLARYADTNGYEKDRTRSIWPYRDWVISAINNDMRFDQFTIEQIAGDMLEGKRGTKPYLPSVAALSPPPAFLSPLIATGFHRNTMINEEGGIDVEEFRYHSVVDRVNTTAAVWLGLTIGCAQCHTHKYDPITQKEYYRLFAFLNNADEPDHEIVSDEMKPKRIEINAKITQLEAALADQFSPGDGGEIEWTALEPASALSAAGSTLTVGKDRAILVKGTADKDRYGITATTDVDSIVAFKLEALTDDSLPKTGPGMAPNGNFVLGEFMVSASPTALPKETKPLKFAKAEADASQKDFDIANTIDGDTATGWAIDDASGKINQNRTAIFHLAAPLTNKGGSSLAISLAQPFGSKHVLGKFRISVGKRKTPAAVKDSAKGQKAHLDAAIKAWIDTQMPDVRAWTPIKPVEMAGKNGGTFIRQPDSSILVAGDNPNQNVYTIEAEVPLDVITAVRLEVLPDESLPNGGPGRAPLFSDGDFHLGEFGLAAAPRNEAAKPVAVKFREASHSFAQGGRSAQQAIDGDVDTAWSIKGGTGRAHQAVFVLKDAIRNDKGFKLVFTLDQRYIHQMTIGKFRLSVTGAALPVKAKTLPAEIEAVLAKGPSTWTDDDHVTIRRHFLLTTPLLARQQKEIEQLRASLPRGQKTMVMQERESHEMRETHIHKRGEFLQPGEVVSGGVPAVLHWMKPTPVAPTRVDFAEWLVDGRNPLVGRVVMNRQWHAFFGRGIVRTTEDFGLQGEQPSHRDLIDWLAVEFVEGNRRQETGDRKQETGDAQSPRTPVRGSAWSMKHMHKLIVMSATYRQSSRVTKQHLERDPQNILLSRGPRFRIEAEMIRDSALAASGLLSRRIGGPSVFPPQPDGVTSLGYGGFNWPTATGENRYRRGLYTFAKRTTPYAAFITFDGPTTDICLIKRDRSNTPLQALTMMNDTVFVEAAQALARRVLTPLPLREGQGEGKANNEAARATPSDTDKATRLFRLVLTRPPSKDETAAITAFVAKQRDRFAKKELDAAKIAGNAPKEIDGKAIDLDELAAWVTAARSVMNLDEALTKE